MRPLFTLLLICVFGSIQAQDFNTDIISPTLLERIEEQPDANQDFYLLLADRLDVLEIGRQFHTNKTPLDQRAYEVITQLQQKAESTQGRYLNILRNHPDVVAGTLNPYWITNVIYLTGTPSLIATLSQMEGIEIIDWDGPLELVAGEGSETIAATILPDGVEAGLEAINSRFMWDKGYTGYGQISFTSDTGVEGDHPALSTNYRGIYAPQNESFFNETYPFDCDDHGTHVTGTIVGLDRLENDTIGVAFNAHWIGGATICGIQGQNTIDAFQWALNPDGNINTFEDMPTVINNSWYNPNVDNCINSYVPVLNALDAVGIAVVFSAGNEGPGTMTITPPHNINTDLVNSFTVGALNGNSDAFLIAGFSSRGPSVCGGTGSLLIKPEVSAPGVSVRSCVLGSAYGLKSGTSMAAPHVSGAILLLKEAFPEASGTDLKLALYFSCTDLGDPGEDNDYGMGIINLEAAYNYLLMEGFEPFDPIVDRDLLLVGMSDNSIFCQGSEMMPEIIVENAGTVDITNFTVEYYTDNGPTFTYEWNGIMLAGERETIVLPSEDVAIGAEWIYSEIILPNGEAEERPLNNKLRIRVQSISRNSIVAEILETENGSFCEDQSAFIRAESEGPGTPSYLWFENEDDTQPIFEGDVFETPVLSGPATYYISANYEAYVGPGFELGETNVLSNAADGEGVVFDALFPFTIKTVLVKAPEAGPRIVELRTQDGDLLATRFIQVPEAGESRIELDIAVPVGESHQLIVGTGLPLAHHSTGADYPYDLEGFASIKRSLTSFGVTTQGYFYFYDWELEIPEPCTRTKVDLIPTGSGNAPGAIFTASETTTTIGTIISFNNQTANANEWLWVFGDGVMSTDENPQHSYTEAGIYTVSLSATSADGCTDVTFVEITVESTFTATNEALLGEGYFEIFPNPASDMIQLKWLDHAPVAGKYYILDAAGRVLSSGNLAGTSTSIQTNQLPGGLYFIQVDLEKESLVNKFVIQR